MSFTVASLQSSLALYSLLLVLFIFLVSSWLKRPSNLPPGPPRGFFGDNRKDVPLVQPWKTFTAWRRRYGDVLSFYLGSTPVIVLGSAKVATDLLEKRGNIYSSRPRQIIAHEIYSGNMRGTGMSYGQQWRNWRALMHAGMGIEASQGYKTLQSIESRILLRDLLNGKDSKDYSSYIRRYVVSVVYAVSYGRRIASLDNEVIRKNLRIDQYFIGIQAPGQFLVQRWPILLALPRSLQWFRREPEKRRVEDTEYYLSLMNEVKRQMDAGIAHACTATRALEKKEEFGMTDVEAAYALSAPSQAGVGTTLSSFEVFLLAMLLYPSTMRKAQEELDAVVGMEHLPIFEQSSSLPYIQAVIKETLRWRPIAPTALPHSVITDDIYEGMFIPKGSTLYPNIYAMTQDEDMFPEPDEFRPERFLDTNDPKFINYTLSFGFGRRICPGMHIANQSLFILITRVLWAFDILPLKDANGKPILPSPHEFTNGLVIAPKPFNYRLVPRRSEVARLILAEADLADAEAVAWM